MEGSKCSILSRDANLEKKKGVDQGCYQRRVGSAEQEWKASQLKPYSNIVGVRDERIESA